MAPRAHSVHFGNRDTSMGVGPLFLICTSPSWFLADVGACQAALAFLGLFFVLQPECFFSRFSVGF